MDAIKEFHQLVTPKKDHPDFKAGDNITVHYKITEGTKERIQDYRGEVIQRKGNGSTQTFTVRKISNGVGVERIFPLFSPSIESIDVNKRGRVRRARLYYLRDLTGKKARIKEKRFNVEIEAIEVTETPVPETAK
jgi:large subunit ribosomal protein L19